MTVQYSERRWIGQVAFYLIFLQVNGMKYESAVTTKCPEITSIASQVQNELKTAGDVNGQTTK